MAVVSVNLKSVDSETDDQGFSNHNARFEVHTDDRDDLSITARDAPGVPIRGDTFAFGNDADVYAWMRRKRASLFSVDETYKKWNVDCFYSNNYNSEDSSLPGGPSGVIEDPLQEPAKWSGGFVQFSKEFQEDINGDPIKNSAGDVFLDPPVVGDQSRMSIVVEKNFLSANIVGLSKYADAVNSVAHWGYGARRLKVQSITFDQRYTLSTPFITARMEVHVHPGSTTTTWDVRLLDAGYYELDVSTGGNKRKRIKDKIYGLDVSTPWPLDGFGAAIENPASTSTVFAYKQFELYPLKNFTDIGFPNVLGAAF